MGVPDDLGNGLDSLHDTFGECSEPQVSGKEADNAISGDSILLMTRTNKRQRGSVAWDEGTLPKIRVTDATLASSTNRRRSSAVNQESAERSPMSGALHLESESLENGVDLTDSETQRVIAPGLRHASLSDVLQYVVNDSLKVGGRPEMTVAHQTDTGEVIEVSSIGPDGVEKVKVVEWSVDAMVPESVLGKTIQRPATKEPILTTLQSTRKTSQR